MDVDMTEEDFKKIIKPIWLMADKKDIPFMETLLLANYNTWRREKQAELIKKNHEQNN